MNALLDKYRSLPRVGRWIVWAVVVLVVYFGAVEPAVDRTARLNRAAASSAMSLAAYERGRDMREQQQSAIKRGLRLFGPANLPGDTAQRSVAFNRRIAEVLDQQGIKNHSSTTRVAPLGSGAPDAIVPSGQRAERLIKELQFDATPEQVSAILAQLEQSPEVSSVSRVQVKRVPEGQARGAGPRGVRANLTVECLVLSGKERSR